MKIKKPFSLLIILFLLNVNLYSQREPRKVTKDTLFFNYDQSILKKCELDSIIVCFEKPEGFRSSTNIQLEMQELFGIKIGKILDMKKYFHRPTLYNDEQSIFKEEKLFNIFALNHVIFIKINNYSERKIYEAIATLSIE